MVVLSFVAAVRVAWVILFVVLVLLEEVVACVCFLIVSVNMFELLQMMTFQVVWVMFLLFVVLVVLEEEVACVCLLIVFVNMKELLQMVTFLHFVIVNV